jgi:hypothetical protein
MIRCASRSGKKCLIWSWLRRSSKHVAIRKSYRRGDVSGAIAPAAWRPAS